MNTFFLLASLLFGNPILSDIFSKCFNDSQIRKINDTKDKRSGGLFLLVSDPELEALSFQRLRCSEFGGLGLTADPTVWKSSENQHKLKKQLASIRSAQSWLDKFHQGRFYTENIGKLHIRLL